MKTEVQGSLLIDAISNANDAQIDGLWAILKCRDMGILRKVLAICEVLSLNPNEVVANLPQDENGRIYDSRNRYILTQALIKASK